MARKKKEKSPTVKPAYPDERLGNFIRGLLLGALIGLVLALFTAKRSGRETRQELRGRLKRAGSQLNDLRKEARGAVEDFSAWASEEERRSLPASTVEHLSLTPASLTSNDPTGPLPQIKATAASS